MPSSNALTRIRTKRLDGGRRSGSASLLAQFKALGFTTYEAQAYLLLLERQPATAYEISKQGALTKGNTYTALESLVAKGAAQQVSDSPARYAAVEPEVLFRQLSRSLTGLCDELVSTLTRPRPQATEHVWTLEGEQTIDNRILDIFERSKRQIWIKGPHHILIRYIDALRSAAARGVQIVVILFGDDEIRRQLKLGPRAQVYLHEGTGLMLAVGARQFVVASDFAEALVAYFDDPARGVYTRSDTVVFLAETMIRHEIYLAEIMQVYGAQIEKRFGKDLMKIRALYLPDPLSRQARTRSGAQGRATPAHRP